MATEESNDALPAAFWYGTRVPVFVELEVEGGPGVYMIGIAVRCPGMEGGMFGVGGAYPG